MDLTDDARKKAALKLIVSRQSMARPFAAPPGTPADRARMLRTAFEATVNDPEFRNEARSLNLDVEPVGGAEVGGLFLAPRGGEARERARARDALIEPRGRSKVATARACRRGPLPAAGHLRSAPALR